jgi:hypothetical protein
MSKLGKIVLFKGSTKEIYPAIISKIVKTGEKESLLVDLTVFNSNTGIEFRRSIPKGTGVNSWQSMVEDEPIEIRGEERRGHSIIDGPVVINKDKE